MQEGCAKKYMVANKYSHKKQVHTNKIFYNESLLV